MKFMKTMFSRLWKFARRGVPVSGISAVAAFAALWSAGCASLNSGTPWTAARVGSPQLLVQSPRAYGWGFLSHPYLERLPNGAIHCGYNLGGDVQGSKARPELAQLSPAISTNEGRSWIVGERAVPFVQHRILNTSVEIGGKRVTYHTQYNPLSTNVTITSFQIDASGAKSEPMYTTMSLPNQHEFGALSEKGVVRTNEILVVGYARFKDVMIGKQQLRKTVLFRSVDEGRTWEFVSFVAEPKDISWGDAYGFEGPCEPALIELPNGELLCVMRTGMVMKNLFEATRNCTDMAVARSADSGRTWTVERLVMHPGVMPRLTVMPNGALVLVYGRPGNMLTVSYDNGHSWSIATTISSPAAKTSGYVGILPVGPNRLLCAYDVFNTDLSGIWLWEPKEVNGVFSVFVEIAPGPNAKGTN